MGVHSLDYITLLKISQVKNNYPLFALLKRISKVRKRLMLGTILLTP